MANPQYPLEHFLEQLAEILRKVEELKAKPQEELIGDLKDQRSNLVLLNNYADFLNKVNAETFKKLGITEEQLQKVVKEPAGDLPARAKRLLKRTEEYKQQLEEMRKEISTRAVMAERKEKHAQKPDKLSKERKKKFRGIGGKDHWKPL